MKAIPSHGGRRFLVPALLVIFAMLVCLRMPQIIIKGRFWAEEGTVFFHNAWTMKPAEVLLISFGGYLNLIANASTLAARWLLPLRLAPYLTILVGLLFQLCAPLLLLTARDRWLESVYVRIVALFLLLLIPGAEEIWLQTLHCQFQLALCCGIILALETEPGKGRLFRYALLLLAPLCGPVAIAILPLFLARAALERSLPRLRQAVALTVGAVIQMLFFFHAVPGRGYSLNPITFLDVFTVRHLYLPFLGIAQTSLVAPLIRARRMAGYVPLRATFLPILVFVPFLVATLRRECDRAAFWLLTAGGLLAGASYFGAIGGVVTLLVARGSDRYTFAPQALFSLAALALAATGLRWSAMLASCSVLWLLIIGGIAYFNPWDVVGNGPPWRREVIAWQADPSHRLQVWPERQGWSLSLDPRH